MRERDCTSLARVWITQEKESKPTCLDCIHDSAEGGGRESFKEKNKYGIFIFHASSEQVNKYNKALRK